MISEGNNLCHPSGIPHTRCVRVSGHVSLLVASTQLCLLDYTLPSALSAGRNICFCFLAQLLPNIHINNREHCSIFFFFFQLIESSKYAVVGSENERCVIAETKHLSTGALRWP